MTPTDDSPSPVPAGPGAPQASVAGPLPPAPRSWNRKLMWGLIGGFGGAAVVGIAIAGIALSLHLVGGGGGGGARGVAQKYLSALVQGDGKTANRLGRVDLDDEDYAMLAPEVFAKAERISSAEIKRDSASSSSDETAFEVAYKLDGKSFHAIIMADLDEKGWFISQGLETRVAAPEYALDSYRLSGAEEAISGMDYGARAYPGVYTLAAPNKYYDVTGKTTLRVSHGNERFPKIELVPNAAFTEEFNAQLKTYFDACVQKTTRDELGECGISFDSPSKIDSGDSHYAAKVVTYPEREVDGDDADIANRASTWSAVTTGEFTATVTGTTYSGAPAVEEVKGGATWVSFRAEVVDGKLVIKAV